ncbi:MAG: nitrile hydratase subunit alpha [Chloroflexi bacterium]|nr:nitrile hydratase subunit alpha [Chloroflexota bacterium]
MSGEHGNGHETGRDEHGHPHPRNVVPFWGKRIYAIRELLVERGLVTEEDIQQEIDYIEARSPLNGARLVARAWVDPSFKQRLLTDSKTACLEMGIDASGINEFMILENTDKLRHVVVCTLCSCYPRQILGRPPDWYKSLNYRRRVVVEPRAVVAEFGQTVPDDVEVRVCDSSADLRYLVLPVRPAGTEGWSEEELARLVTRDSLVGVTQPLEPSAVRV